MKVTPWCLAALAPIAVVGCSGTFLGHFAVLALTLGIFFGTLSLGRHSAARDGAALVASVPSVTSAISVASTTAVSGDGVLAAEKSEAVSAVRS